MIIDYNNIPNIKNLPVIEEITPGNALFVFKTNKPFLLDFDNFIITESNTSYYTVMDNNITNIYTLSTDVILLSNIVLNDTVSNTEFQSVSTTLNSLITSLSSENNTRVDDMTASISSSLDGVSSYTRYIPRGWIVLNSGGVVAKGGVISTGSFIGGNGTVTYTPPFIDTNYMVMGTIENPISETDESLPENEIVSLTFFNKAKNLTSFTIKLSDGINYGTATKLNIIVYSLY